MRAFTHVNLIYSEVHICTGECLKAQTQSDTCRKNAKCSNEKELQDGFSLLVQIQNRKKRGVAVQLLVYNSTYFMYYCGETDLTVIVVVVDGHDFGYDQHILLFVE